MRGLEIKHLTIEADNRPILKDISLTFEDQAIYGLIGHNGSGKSTLVNTIMGSPDYQITSGQILLDGQDITRLPSYQRARLGLFLASQYPVEITGLNYGDFLKASLNNLRQPAENFVDVATRLNKAAKELGFASFDLSRDLNVGFSGGEKKKSEILQMIAFKPRFAFLDEPDSGLDKASLKKLISILSKLDYPTTLVVISHHESLINQLKPLKIYRLGEEYEPSR